MTAKVSPWLQGTQKRQDMYIGSNCSCPRACYEAIQAQLTHSRRLFPQLHYRVWWAVNDYIRLLSSSDLLFIRPGSEASSMSPSSSRAYPTCPVGCDGTVGCCLCVATASGVSPWPPSHPTYFVVHDVEIKCGWCRGLMQAVHWQASVYDRLSFRQEQHPKLQPVLKTNSLSLLSFQLFPVALEISGRAVRTLCHTAAWYYCKEHASTGNPMLVGCWWAGSAQKQKRRYVTLLRSTLSGLPNSAQTNSTHLSKVCGVMVKEWPGLVVAALRLSLAWTSFSAAVVPLPTKELDVSLPVNACRPCTSTVSCQFGRGCVQRCPVGVLE